MSTSIERDPQQWAMILTASDALAETPPTGKLWVPQQHAARRLFQRVVLGCGEDEIAGRKLYPSEENDAYRPYAYGRTRVMAGGGNSELTIWKSLPVKRSVMGYPILDANKPRYSVSLWGLVDLWFASDEVIENFTYGTDAVSLEHELRRDLRTPDVWAEGEAVEENPYTRLSAYLIHGCEAAHVT